MSEARTKLDILYQDVLGDVKEILDKVDDLKTGLPHAFDETRDKLQIQVENILANAKQLEQRISEVTKQMEIKMQTSVQASIDVAKLDLKKSAEDSVGVVIKKSANDLEDNLLKVKGIGDLIEDHLRTIAEDAISSIDTAKKKFDSERNWFLFYQLITSIAALILTNVSVRIVKHFFT